MHVELKPGRYVLAVSGGVDSMALLDILRRQPGIELTVAHFDHGIRPDSGQDRELVKATAEGYGLPFVFARGNLGVSASEAVAREARYSFLRRVCAEKGARLITAHHQDDILETAIINILRGTGPRGLAALAPDGEILRPLAHVRKADLLAYAKSCDIRWREDSTNQDTRHLRNYIRHNILPKFSPAAQAELLGYIQKAGRAQQAISRICSELRSGQPSSDALGRKWFIGLPHKVSAEYLADWFRSRQIPYDRPSIERLVVFIKTAAPGKNADIQAGYRMIAHKNTVEIVH